MLEGGSPETYFFKAIRSCTELSETVFLAGYAGVSIVGVFMVLDKQSGLGKKSEGAQERQPEEFFNGSNEVAAITPKRAGEWLHRPLGHAFATAAGLSRFSVVKSSRKQSGSLQSDEQQKKWQYYYRKEWRHYTNKNERERDEPRKKNPGPGPSYITNMLPTFKDKLRQ